MRTISLQIPDSLEWPDRDLHLLMAAKLFEAGALSISQAAAVNLNRRAFMEILGRFEVSVISYDSSELENDLKNAEAYCLN